jgi:hypothetical protein
MDATVTVKVDGGTEVDIESLTGGVDPIWMKTGTGGLLFEITVSGVSITVIAERTDYQNYTTTRVIVSMGYIDVKMQSYLDFNNNPLYAALTIKTNAIDKSGYNVIPPGTSVKANGNLSPFVADYYDAPLHWQIDQRIVSVGIPIKVTVSKTGYGTKTKTFTLYMDEVEEITLNELVQESKNINFNFFPPYHLQGDVSTPGGKNIKNGSPFLRSGQYVQLYSVPISPNGTQVVFVQRAGYKGPGGAATPYNFTLSYDDTRTETIIMQGKSTINVVFESKDSANRTITGSLTYEIQEQWNGIWYPIIVRTLSAGNSYADYIAPKADAIQRLVITSVPAGYSIPDIDYLNGTNDLLENVVTSKHIILNAPVTSGVYDIYVYCVAKPRMWINDFVSNLYSGTVEVGSDDALKGFYSFGPVWQMSGDMKGTWKFTLGNTDHKFTAGNYEVKITADLYKDLIFSDLTGGKLTIPRTGFILMSAIVPDKIGVLNLYIKPNANVAGTLADVWLTDTATSVEEQMYATPEIEIPPYPGYYLYTKSFTAGHYVKYKAKRTGYKDITGTVLVPAYTSVPVVEDFGEPNPVKVEFRVKPLNATLKVNDKFYIMSDDEYEYNTDGYAVYFIDVIPNGSSYYVGEVEEYNECTGVLSADSVSAGTVFKVSLELKKPTYRSIRLRVSPGTTETGTVTVTGATKEITLMKIEQDVLDTCGQAYYETSNQFIGVVDINDIKPDGHFDIKIDQKGYTTVIESVTASDFELEVDHIKGDSGQLTNNKTLKDDGSFYCFTLGQEINVTLDIEPSEFYYIFDEGEKNELSGSNDTSFEFDSDDPCHSLRLESEGYITYDSKIIFEWPVGDTLPDKDYEKIIEFFDYLNKDSENDCDIKNMAAKKIGNYIFFYTYWDTKDNNVHYKITKADDKVKFFKYNKETLNYSEILKRVSEDETQQPLDAVIIEKDKNYVFVDRKTLCFKNNDVFKHVFEKNKLKLKIILREEATTMYRQIKGDIELKDNKGNYYLFEDVSEVTKSFDEGSIVEIKIEKDHYEIEEDTVQLYDDEEKTFYLSEFSKYSYEFKCNVDNSTISIETDDVVIDNNRDQNQVIVTDQKLPYYITLYYGKYKVTYTSPTDTNPNSSNYGNPTHLSRTIYVDTSSSINSKMNTISLILDEWDWKTKYRTSYCTVDDVRSSVDDINKNTNIRDAFIAKNIIKAEGKIDFKLGNSEPFRLQKIFDEETRNSIGIIRTLAIDETLLLILNYDKEWFLGWNEYEERKAFLENEVSDIYFALSNMPDKRFLKKLGNLV